MAEPNFRDRVSLLLAGLEEGREVRAYLRRFTRGDEGCFAVVKVGGAVIDQDLEPLADALALLQYLGLPPVVVYGAGPQLDRDLGAAGIAEERRDGLRLTPAEAVPHLVRAAGRTATLLTTAMRARGAAAVPVQPGTVRARLIDRDRYGLVGDVAEVDTDALSAVLASGAVPLLGCVHADEGGQLLNINADGVARSVATALCPQKIVFVTGTGGLLDGKGELIDSVNLAADGEALFASPWLEGGMRHKLTEIADLLSGLDPSSSVSITSAGNMVRELFTHTGAGTLVRRGERILSRPVGDAGTLGPLIEGAFRKTLKRSYWERLDAELVLMSERGRAGAIVSRLGGVPLLDKFAVAGEARGEGLAKSLWHALRQEAPELIWRSRRDNPFNAYYTAQADGFVRRGPWTVFWIGRDLEVRIGELADTLSARSGDFEGET